MLSYEDACACLETAASELKEYSYEELEKFARCQGMLDDWQTRELLVEGEKIEVNTLIGKLGWRHKRISVEMTIHAEGDVQWSGTPCVYFERYKSGRLYAPEEKKWQELLLKALPYVFIGGVVIGLLALVWHLFLRGG